jgi:tetratricopeptide (TPR) repeat protein
MDAYEHYLHARAALLAGSERHRGEGRELLRRSISLDPGFAPAYGRLALLHTGEYHQRRYGRGAAALARALEMARTAVEMDPSLPEAHWVLAYVSTQRRRHDEALAHLERALTVAPSFADAFALKAGIKTYVGEPEASIGLLDVALQLRPAASHHHFLLLGRARFFLDDLDQAARDLRKALERNPASLEARIYLAATLHRNGDQEGARWEAEEIRAIEPGFAAGNWLDSYPMTDARQIQHLVSALRSLGL